MIKTSILVTGGAGYIGSQTCKCLSEKGYLPVTIDNLSTGNEWAVKYGPFFNININDSDSINKILKEYNIKSVLHFAAYSNVGESVINPMKYYENNVSNSIIFLNNLIKNGVDKFVFSSTAAVYGEPKFIPIFENQQTNPISPYGETKLIFENILSNYNVSKNIKSVILRYFNAAGADLEAEVGEMHSPETHLIPNIILSAINKKTFKIFGGNYDTNDGTAIRDYIHVVDLANAHIEALEYLINGGNNLKLNIGTGKGFSVKEILLKCEEYLGPISYEINPKRKGDPPILIADVNNISKHLNWFPKYSDIDTIINSAVSWYKNLEDKQNDN